MTKPRILNKRESETSKLFKIMLDESKAQSREFAEMTKDMRDNCPGIPPIVEMKPENPPDYRHWNTT